MEVGWRNKRGRQIGVLEKLFYKTLIYFLVFFIAFLGVPLPIPRYAPKPLRIVKDLLDTPDAEATEQVEKVQSGSASITGVSRSTTASITVVDLEKSFLVMSCEGVGGVGSIPAGATSGEFGSTDEL